MDAEDEDDDGYKVMTMLIKTYLIYLL